MLAEEAHCVILSTVEVLKELTDGLLGDRLWLQGFENLNKIFVLLSSVFPSILCTSIQKEYFVCIIPYSLRWFIGWRGLLEIISWGSRTAVLVSWRCLLDYLKSVLSHLSRWERESLCGWGFLSLWSQSEGWRTMKKMILLWKWIHRVGKTDERRRCFGTHIDFIMTDAKPKG